MSFLIATYNVLATAYIKPAYYPRTPPEWLEPRRRVRAVADHLAGMDADLLCLQEVEGEMFAAADRRLTELGYAGDLAPKGNAKPDGCAAFFRTGVLEPVRLLRREYDDEREDQPHSGHVAQILVLKVEGRLLGVANTHLRWSKSGTPREQQYGYRQVRELLKARFALAPECDGWIVCGDLNVTMDSDVVGVLTDAGFTPSHGPETATPTCNPNGHLRRLDFIFHDAALRADPIPGPILDTDTPLPGPDHPSDHVPVRTRLTWNGDED